MNIDALIGHCDRGLRTLFGKPRSGRATPGAELSPARLSDAEKRRSAALMRVNHSGEVCAQALYQGQALTARNPELQLSLARAAEEETEHLAWTRQRITDLGGHTSFLNPVWYFGSLAIGAAAGTLGDKWNLGFLAETERQVVRHLDHHLELLPAPDQQSRAVLEQMKADESKHAIQATAHGGALLPSPVRLTMKLSSKLMTKTAFWI